MSSDLLMYLALVCVFFSEASRKLARKALESFRAEHADTIANAVVPWRLSDTKVVLMVFCLLYGVLCASSLSYNIMSLF